MAVDKGKQLKFPQHFTTTTTTTLHPDMVLWSDSTKQVVILELTAPWEENLDEAFGRKLAKYEDLTSQCRQSSWRGKCLPIKTVRGQGEQVLPHYCNEKDIPPLHQLEKVAIKVPNKVPRGKTKKKKTTL